MRTKRYVGGAAVVGLSVVLAACGGGAGDGEASGNGETYSVGLVRFASSDPASEGIVTEYVAYGEERGWDVNTVDPQGSADQAISGINNFVQAGVDLIVVAVFPSDALTAGVRAATAADIPVVSIGGGTAEGVPISLDFGASQARPLAELLIEDMGGTGEVLVLGYTPGLPCVGREEELMAQLQETDISVSREEVPVPGQVEAGTRFARAWLAKHPQGSGPLAIWGCFGDPAVGAVAALRETGREDVLVYGHDGTEAALSAVKSGDMRADVFFDPAAEGTRLAKGTPEYIEAGVDAEERLLAPEIHLVTEENVAELAEQFTDLG